MVTYYISSSCFAAALAKGEQINLRPAVSSCLLAAGFMPWRDMEAELFDCGQQALLIVRPHSPRLIRLCRGFPRLHRR